MTKSEQTRSYIIERTAPLFNSKGYDGTSLKDLTDITGLTKGALYGNFLDKDEIAEEAFKYSINKVKAMIRSHLGEKLTYKKQLIALLEFYAQYVFNPPIPGGCPLLNSAIESDDHRKTMRRVVVKELINTIDFISSLLTSGIEAGEFSEDIKPREIAYTFFCAIEGALMFARVERSSEPMDIIVEHCKNILNNISKN